MRCRSVCDDGYGNVMDWFWYKEKDRLSRYLMSEEQVDFVAGSYDGVCYG